MFKGALHTLVADVSATAGGARCWVPGAAMKVGRSLRSGVAAVMAAFAISFAYSSTAGAIIVYDFAGTCVPACAGDATAILTLEDTYTPGEVVLAADFVSFSYASSTGSYEVPTADLISIQGRLPEEAGLSLNFFAIESSSGSFVTSNNGIWQVAVPGVDDSGIPYRWRRVPEPAAVLLLGAGLLGVAVTRKRRLKEAA